MSDFGEFWLSPNAVFPQNLSALSKMQLRVGEQKLCELSLMAKDLVDGMAQASLLKLSCRDVLAFLSSSDLSFPTADLPQSSPSDRAALQTVISSSNTAEKAFFAAELLSRLDEKGVLPAESDFFDEYNLPAAPLVSYVKNPLADEAFDVLSDGNSSLRVSYAPTLRASVENVNNGSADYCLLPFEEAGGIRIAATADLIFRNDLHIVSVTPVFGALGEADMRYALVGREVVCPSPAESDDRYLELVAPSDVPLTEVLLAAESLDLSVYRVFAVTSDGSIPQKIVLSSDGKSFAPFLLWSSLFCERLTTVGIYTNLE